jgi:hemerythrin
MHKGEHDRVLADMAAHVEAWEQNHDDAVLKNWLEQEVGNWFVNHVNTMDFITATFIASRR